ncbi:DUF2514 family protein [Pseudomonas sp. Pseusp122]|uniref:DUF2514 family protein n=1 Tax=unclassified Pseudomonas TaxID=196821 RepID=UPI0039A542BE
MGEYRHGANATEHKWQARWAEQIAITAKSRAEAERAARAEEQRRQQAANEIDEHARLQLETAALDAADSDRAGQRLHDQARQLAAMSNHCPGDTATAERTQTATRAAMVLSDPLERADQRAGELAHAYDRARLVGRVCELTYHQVRDNR